MATITLTELHEHTSEWLHGAAQLQEIIVTDNGKPLVRIAPIQPASETSPFTKRKLLPGFAALQSRLQGGTDSTQIISEARE
jgi:prevent-host-death family protein